MAGRKSVATSGGFARWYVGKQEAPSRTPVRKQKDIGGEPVALIVVENERRRRAAEFNYQVNGYRVISMPTTNFLATRSVVWVGAPRYTLVTDDLDIILLMRLEQLEKHEVLPIHAVVEDGEVLQEMRATEFGADAVLFIGFEMDND